MLYDQASKLNADKFSSNPVQYEFLWFYALGVSMANLIRKQSFEKIR